MKAVERIGMKLSFGVLTLLLVVPVGVARADSECKGLIGWKPTSKADDYSFQDISRHVSTVISCTETENTYWCMTPVATPGTKFLVLGPVGQCEAEIGKELWYGSIIQGQVVAEQPDSLIEKTSCPTQGLYGAPSLPSSKAVHLERCSKSSVEAMKPLAQALSKEIEARGSCTRFDGAFAYDGALILEVLVCECGTDGCGTGYYKVTSP